MRKALDRLLELLYPPRCAFCHHLMPSGVKVCEHCLKTLPYAEGGAQTRKLAHIAACVSPLLYKGHVRESLHRYKFGGVTAYAEIYGEFLSKCIDENGISCDSITWVPLSRRRRFLRGYDQARLLAEDLSRRSGLPCVRMLRKTRNNPAQSGTGGAAARRANVSGVYRAEKEELIRGRHILLVDDIVTTGATLSECAAVLRRTGAAEVYAAAVACTEKQ